MNQVVIKFSILASLIFTGSSTSFAERLGVCGLEGSSAACESKSTQAFRVAARVIGSIIISCKETNFFGPGKCTVDPFEQNLAKRLESVFRQNQEVVKIEFKSERENPGFFLLDGQVRIAKTDLHLGDVVFINTDIVEANNTEISEALAILAHELGHHIGVTDHQKLDQFGATIKEFSTRFQLNASEVLPGANNSNQFADLSIFNLTNTTFGRLPYVPMRWNSTLILWDGSDYIDLTPELMPILCESGYQVHSLTAKSTAVAQSGDSLVIKAPIFYSCVPSFGFGTNHADLNAYGTLPTKKIGDRVFIDVENIKWELKKCTEDPELGC